MTISRQQAFLQGRRVRSQSEAETLALAAAFARELKGGECLALHGNLGAGKTVFARGLARGFGIEEPVTSPTFTIVQEYQGPEMRFYHMDLYRLEDPFAVLDFGLDDYLADEAAVTAIEWPERLASLLPQMTMIHLQISHTEDGRELQVSR